MVGMICELAIYDECFNTRAILVSRLKPFRCEIMPFYHYLTTWPRYHLLRLSLVYIAALVTLAAQPKYQNGGEN